MHALPVAHAIKRCFPTSHIGWIVQKTFAPIIENDPAVDEVIPIFIPSTSDPNAGRGAFYRAFKAVISVMRELRLRFAAQPYDVVLDLHASFRSGLLSLTNPGGLRIGFADAKELNPLFQRERLSTDPAKPHAVDKNTVFADFLGCPPQPVDYHIAVSAEARDKVKAFLEEQGLPENHILIYANPAARWETKYWTISAWAELADMLIGRGNIRVVFAGSPQDGPYIEGIAELMKERPIVAAGALNLTEATALLERSDAYVGLDSGPMHIAAFTGTPVIALFGPTEPHKVGPYGEGHLVITHSDLDCLGCRKRQCPDRRCMEEITPAEVCEAVLERVIR